MKRFAQYLIIAVLALSLVMITRMAHAEAFIAFDPITSGQLSFDSLALNVDDKVMFSQLSGGLFYKENGQARVLPIWGACQQANGSYYCTFQDGIRSFQMTLDKKTKKGKVWPISGTFESYSQREASLIEVTPMLTVF